MSEKSGPTKQQIYEILVKSGSTADWITPMVAGYKDFIEGANHTFLIPEGVGFSGRKIKRMLRRKRIKTWGHMCVESYILITVPWNQSHKAQYILESNNVPFYNEAPDKRPGCLISWVPTFTASVAGTIFILYLVSIAFQLTLLTNILNWGFRTLWIIVALLFKTIIGLF